MNTRTRVFRWAPPIVAIGASLLLLSACAGNPGGCSDAGALAGVGATGGTVKGSLPGNPTGGTSDGGYGGASVGMASDPNAVDSASGCM